MKILFLISLYSMLYYFYIMCSILLYNIYIPYLLYIVLPVVIKTSNGLYQKIKN